MNPAQSTVTITLDGIEFNDIVPKHQRFDPEIEDLIYGEELVEGMVVLVETVHRYSESPSFEGFYRHELPVSNRWCEVTKLRTGEDDTLNFIGVYTDGQKAVRFSAPTYGWVVKKDSIKERDNSLVCDPRTCEGASCVLDHPSTSASRYHRSSPPRVSGGKKIEANANHG